MNFAINNYFQNIVVAFCIGLNIMFASCASYMKVYPEPINIQSSIEQGDTVKIMTKDNEEIQFKVKEITSDAFIGEKDKVFYKDILKIEKMTASAMKNTLGGTVLVLLSVFYVAGMSGM